MHSINLKVVTDFNVISTTRKCCFPGRKSGFEKKHWLNFSESARNCRIVACSPEKNGDNTGKTSSSSGSGASLGSGLGSSSRLFLSRSQTYALLKQQMEVAAQSEDYEEAARIRDSLRIFEEEEPVLRLRRLLKEAIMDERFEDAAKYRDELKEIAPHSLLKCSSDATTLSAVDYTELLVEGEKRATEFGKTEYSNGNQISILNVFQGIRVQVRSVYIEGRSQPSKGQYFFAYRIRITNNSDRPVQLLRRHWIITDANGRTENVWGTGVIGEQPVILPRTGFEYSSACPLCSPNGRMEGDFEMKHIDKVGSPTFNVAIAPFSLSILGDESDTL